MADWTYWRAALNGRPLPPMSEGDYAVGYYRKKEKGGIPSAVAIWEDDDGKIVGKVNSGKLITDPDKLFDLFSWSCRQPITYEAYGEFMRTGKWADIDETVAAIASGSNQEEMSEEQLLRANLAEYLAAAKAYKAVKDEETMAKVAGLRDSIGKTKGKLEKIREAEKAPHLKAGKEIDDRFRDAKADAEKADTALKLLLNAYADEKLQAQRKAEREAREAEAARAAEAEKARLAEVERLKSLDKEDLLEEMLKPRPEAPAPAPVVTPAVLPTKVATGVGRAASVRIRKAANVTDMKACLAYFSETEELHDFIRAMAQEAVDLGQTPAGVEIEEKTDVRR